MRAWTYIITEIVSTHDSCEDVIQRLTNTKFYPAVSNRPNPSSPINIVHIHSWNGSAQQFRVQYTHPANSPQLLLRFNIYERDEQEQGEIHRGLTEFRNNSKAKGGGK